MQRGLHRPAGRWFESRSSGCPTVAQRQSSRQRLLLFVTALLFSPLRSSEDAGPHKPAREGSNPSAATKIPESFNVVGHAALTRATKVRILSPERKYLGV